MGATISKNTSWPTRQVALGITAVAVAGLAALCIGRKSSTSKSIADGDTPEKPRETAPRPEDAVARQVSRHAVDSDDAFQTPRCEPTKPSDDKVSPNGPSSSAHSSEAKTPMDQHAMIYTSAQLLHVGVRAERKNSGDLGFRSRRCDEGRMPLEPEVIVESVGAYGCRPTVYCDLDGTLCDFEGEVAKIFKCQFKDIDKKRLWPGVAKQRDFYNKLPWMKEGKQLWDGIQVLAPVILSGVPRQGGAAASSQKRKWVRRELGEHVPILTCFKSDKWRACRPGDILIDDDTIHRRDWEAQGGIFVHHSTESSTLALLAQLFILPPPPQLAPLCWVQVKWSGEWWWCKVLSQEAAFTEVEFMEPPYSGEKYMMTANNLRFPRRSRSSSSQS